MSLPASTWLWRFLDLYVKRGFIQKSGTSIEAHIVCYLRADCFLCTKIWSFWVFRILLHFLGLWAPCDNKPQDFKLKKNDILKLSKFASTVSTPTHPVPVEGCQPQHPWNCLSPHDSYTGSHRDTTETTPQPGLPQKKVLKWASLLGGGIPEWKVVAEGWDAVSAYHCELKQEVLFQSRTHISC